LINPYKQYFPNLDALRFFAFFAVFTAHITHLFMDDLSGHSTLTILFNYSQLGILGVNFFFVLSAFLITFLIYEEKAATRYFSFTKYYIRRSLRIWPLYYLMVFIGFVIVPAFKHVQGIPYAETANVWYYVFFLSNVFTMYFGQPLTPVLFVIWSIAVEEQFYIFWPFLLTFFTKGREVILFFLLIAGALIFRYVNHNNYIVLYLHPLSIMSDFGIGGLLAYFSFKKGKAFSLFSNMGGGIIALGYLCFLTLVYINFQIFQIPWLYVGQRCVWGLFFAFIIFEQCFCKRSPFKFGKIKLFSELGKRSYGLYCFHEIGILIGLNILKYADPYHLHLNEYIIEPIMAFAFTVILAYASYQFFESPFLKLKNKFGF